MAISRNAEALGATGPRAGSPIASLPFCAVILYLIFEYGRPQEVVPVLGALHLPGIATAFLILLIWLSRHVRLSDLETTLFICLLALMTLHVPIALNNYWAFHTARAMLMTFAAYLAIITFVDNLQRFKALVAVWLAIHAYLAIMGIRDSGIGIGGFLGDENEFAMALNMVLPFSFFLAVTEPRNARRMFYIGLTSLFAFVSILSFSRAGFLGLLAVGSYCWLRSPKKLLALGMLGVLALLAVQFAPDGYWDEINSIRQGTSDPNAEDRIYQWKIGWTMFLDNPVLGVGQGNFPSEFRRYELASGFYHGLHGRSRAGRAAHSLYVTLLSELGLLGTAIWLVLLGRLCANARSVRRALTHRAQGTPARPPAKLPATDAHRLVFLSVAMEASLVGYLVGGVFNSVLYYPNFWLLMAFVAALNKIAWRAHEDDCAPRD